MPIITITFLPTMMCSGEGSRSSRFPTGVPVEWTAIRYRNGISVSGFLEREELGSHPFKPNHTMITKGLNLKGKKDSFKRKSQQQGHPSMHNFQKVSRVG